MATTPGVPLTGLTDTADLRNGTVLVPAGSVAGEPIAYDQASWQLGGGTFTATTRVVGDTSGGNTDGLAVRNTNVGVPANKGAVRLQVTAAGDVQLRREDDSDVTSSQPRVFTFNTSSVLALSPDGSVTVPAATAATHAAQVSAIDATTGRLAIGGQEIGDTGWRNVTADLFDTWAGVGTALIRRMGNIVYMNVSEIQGTTTRFYDPPLGFRPEQQGAEQWLTDAADQPIRFHSLGTTQFRIYYTDGTAPFRGQVSWPAAPTWPTSLPGTAASFETQLPA